MAVRPATRRTPVFRLLLTLVLAPLLARAASAEVVPLVPGDFVSFSSFSDSPIKRLDRETGELVPWPGLPITERLQSLAVADDGSIFVAGSGGVWRVAKEGLLLPFSLGETGKLLFAEGELFLRTPEAILRIDVETGERSELAGIDGYLLVAGGPGELLTFWDRESPELGTLARVDTATGELRVIPHPRLFVSPAIRTMALLDSRTLFVSQGTLRPQLFDLVTLESTTLFDVSPRLAGVFAFVVSSEGGGGGVAALSGFSSKPGGVFRFSPDLQETNDDLDRGPSIGGPPGTRVRDIAFGPKGRVHLLELTNKGYRVRYESKRGWKKIRIAAQTLRVLGLALDPDGTLLSLHKYTRPDDRRVWRVIGWDPTTGEPMFRRDWRSAPQKNEDLWRQQGLRPGWTVDDEGRIAILSDLGFTPHPVYEDEDGDRVHRIEWLVPERRSAELLVQTKWPRFRSLIAALPDGDLIARKRGGQFVRVDPRDGDLDEVVRGLEGRARPLLVGANNRVASSSSEPDLAYKIVDAVTGEVWDGPQVPGVGRIRWAYFDADCQILMPVGGDVVRLDPKTGETTPAVTGFAVSFALVIPEPGRPELRCRLPRAR